MSDREEKLTKFSYLREQREALIRHITLLEEKLEETNVAKKTLEALDNAGEGEVLMPIGGGCYVEAELKKLDKVIINIGDGVSKEASVEESLSKLDENSENINKSLSNMKENLSNVERELRSIQREFQEQT